MPVAVARRRRRLFERPRLPGVSTRSIAEAAGTSETILFRHFATKDDLFDNSITRPWTDEVASSSQPARL